MVFSSTIFLFAFLPFTLLGYYLIRSELRNLFLLMMSIVFYAWGEPKFVFILIIYILVNYFMGLLIHISRNNSLRIRRIVLVLALMANIGLLFYYKYIDFFINNINILTGTHNNLLGVILPIGISFFTFQGMSYIIDLYLGKVQVQKNLLKFALYKSLFPQLIAGPIVRYKDVYQQIDHRTLSVDQFAEGVKRFIKGLGKKMIIANSFAIAADRAFSATPAELSVAAAWIGAISYTIQIYFDFSGYSDMAIGLGKMFGFDFLENFNYPYISKTITEFWRRWHISLSSWFRDYLYIPLGGNRTGNVYVNLLIVFVITGLWHGASWNFVLWGLWHGLFLVIERVQRTLKIQLPVPTFLKWLYTMLVVVIGWVLFRATDLPAALAYMGSMFGLQGNSINDAMSSFMLADNWKLFIFAVLFSMPLVPKLRQISATYMIPNQIAEVFVPVFYIGLFIVCIAFTVTSTYNPFIYFNF